MPGFLQVFKLFSVKQFLSHGTLIALNMSIVERLSWWYHLLSYSPLSYYLLKLPRPEFRAIIPSEDSRRAILPAKTFKIISNETTKQRVLHGRLKVSTGKHIQDIEYPESYARGYTGMKKISCRLPPQRH